jgi:hypothetical protein
MRPPLRTILLVATLFAGCSGGDDDPNNPVLACDEPSNHTCTDYGFAFSQAEAADDCEGDVLQGPCSPMNTVGECAVSQGGFTLTKYFYGTGWDEASADTQCTDEGGTPQ